MDKSIFKKGKKYTFSDYFNLNNPTEEILAELGYSFSVEVLQLPMAKKNAAHNINSLINHFYAILPKVSLNSEMAKRDFMIAPLLSEVIAYVDAKINVEYIIEIDDLLSGSLDYLIRSKQDIIVIEAKKSDLEKGFNQLAAELIALDKYENETSPALLYGAVSMGDVWRFGILNRKSKHIVKDIHSYRVPEDTEKVFNILLGILQSSTNKEG